MKFECKCRLKFEIVPREIPLNAPEPIYCQNCKREINGPRSTRYADYIPIDQTSDTHSN